MDIARLREYIVDNGCVFQILESLECHHIVDKGNYISAGNPDGDNKNAINVYKDTLVVVDYTRHITNKKVADIFDLVSFFLECTFFEAVKKICEVIGLSVYHDFDEDLPESIELTKFLLGLISSDDSERKEKPLKPIPEKILSYYEKCSTKQFADDNISPAVQEEMELGYDQLSNRITIPIRDEYGTLVGVKGRWLGETPKNDDFNKYIYIEPCAKSKILYGLYRAIPYIKEAGCCYVVESEKAVLQGMSMGFNNMVACGGKLIKEHQIEMLSRLCVDIIICFDKDVQRDELEEIASRFIGDVSVWAIIDDMDILGEKESPTDDPSNFMFLNDECKVQLRIGGVAV